MTPPSVIAKSWILRLHSEQAPQSRRYLPPVIARLAKPAEAISVLNSHFSVFLLTENPHY